MKKSHSLSVALIGLSSGCFVKCLCPASFVSVAQSTRTSISDESVAVQSSINGPRDLAYDKSGFLYIHEVVGGRLIRLDIKHGTVKTIETRVGDGGADEVIATDRDGNLLIASNDGQIKELTSTGATIPLQANKFSEETIFFSIADDGRGGILGTRGTQLFRWTPEGLQTVAGVDRSGFFGDGGPAREARFRLLFGVAVNAVGDIFVADNLDCRIRKIDARTLVVSTIAGNGECRSTGDDGPATMAALSGPSSIAVDREGNLFFAESSGRVRRIDKDGIISNYAGIGERGFSGDGGLATKARLDPTGLSTDDVGNLYIADYAANRIRRVDAVTHVITTVAGNGLPKRNDVYVY